MSPVLLQCVSRSACLTLQEAAKRLYITPERVLRRVENGRIEGAIVDGQPVVVAASLTKYRRLFETFDALDKERTPPASDEINTALAESRQDWKPKIFRQQNVLQTSP